MRKRNEIRDNRFPISLFFVYLGLLLLVGGFHMGLMVLMARLEVSPMWQVHLMILYWLAVATALTTYTWREIRKYYEKPLHDLADATRRVAEGDFSVYVPPTHTSDRLDYIDVMLVDFNKMVGELGSVETLRTDFFSNVSHEIKTPLAQIQNNAELLRNGELSDEQRENVDRIYWASKRLDGLINNLLKLNKLEKQTILPDVTTYDLCEQLAECALSHEEAWERQKLEFEADMEDCVMITADQDLMELVWNNLFSNAVKFNRPGGKITLTEVSDDNEIRVTVSDTGCGMSEETRAHIFEKFYQGDTSHAMAGNGLGLPLALRVLQLNGFTIEVESTPGEGSAFTVIIPKAEKDDGRE